LLPPKKGANHAIHHSPSPTCAPVVAKEQKLKKPLLISRSGTKKDGEIDLLEPELVAFLF